MVSDIEDYLAWLRDKRGKAAQTLSTYRRLLRRFEEVNRPKKLGGNPICERIFP